MAAKLITRLPPSTKRPPVTFVLSRSQSLSRLARHLAPIRIHSRSSRTFTSLTPRQLAALHSESQQKRQTWYASEEPLDRYCEGGYHPVHIGDEFQEGRYVVVRKLGWGRYSTIWLAKDKSKDRYVSLKILTAEWAPREDLLSEAAFLRKASTANPSHPGYPHVLTLLDEFCLKGPNGEHIVLVTDVLGEDLVRVRRRYESGRLPVGVVKQVAKQVLLGLQYLHEDCGITHTDVKPDNILIALPSPDVNSTGAHAASCEISNRFIEQCLSVLKPQSETVTSPSGESIPISVSQALPIFAMRKETNGSGTHPLEINVKIVDLGVANWTEDHWADTIQSPAMRAPEVVLGAGWDTKADVWSAGCMIYELLTGEWLFAPVGGKTYTQEQEHLAQMCAALGPMPEELMRKGKHAHRLVDAQGKLPPCPSNLENPLPAEHLPPRRRQDTGDGDEDEQANQEPEIPPPSPLEKRLERLDILPPEEFVGCVSFLRAMLQLDPEKRATAREMVLHQWVREGAQVGWWSGV